MTTIEQQNGSGRRLPGAARARTFAEPTAAPQAPAVPPAAEPAPAPVVEQEALIAPSGEITTTATDPHVAAAPQSPAADLDVDDLGGSGTHPPHQSTPPAQTSTAVVSTGEAIAEWSGEPQAADEPQAFDVPTAPAPRITPSTAVVTWEPAPLDESPATWGRKQAIIRALTFGLVKPKPGAEELAHRENERVIRSATWPRSVRIVVANPKGGSGKTPVSLVLGGAMARVRGGSVAVWDAADAPGTLHVVAEGTARRCVAEIAADPEGYAYPGTIAAVATTQTTGADALVSLSNREFTGPTVRRVQWALDRTHRVSIADTGNVAHSSAFRQFIATADVLVIPTVIQQSQVDSALRLLHRLGSTDLVQRAVVAILHTGAPQTPGLAKDIDKLFTNAGISDIVHIPYDRHIAAGSTITYDRLSRPSQLAWTRLATATVANITA